MSLEEKKQLEYILTELGKSYQKTNLTVTEKQSLYFHIQNTMGKTKLPGSKKSLLSNNQVYPSPFTNIYRINRAGLRITAVAIVIASVLGTSLLAVSAQSLPGETLYGTKIAFEDLRSELTSNSEARLAYDLSRTAHRFGELQKLNQTGTLTPETATIVIKHIEEHTISATEASHALAFAKPHEHKKVFTPLKDTLSKEVEDLTKSIIDTPLSTNQIVESTLAEVTRIAEEAIQEAEKIEVTLDEVLSEETISTESLPTPTPDDTINPVVPTEAAESSTDVIDARIERITTKITPLLSLTAVPLTPVSIEVTTPLATPITEPITEAAILAPNIQAPIIHTDEIPTVSVEPIREVLTTTTRVETSSPTGDLTNVSAQDIQTTRILPETSTPPSEEVTIVPPSISTTTHIVTVAPSQKDVERATLLIEDLKRDYTLLLSAREEKNFEASLKLLDKIELILSSLPDQG